MPSNPCPHPTVGGKVHSGQVSALAHGDSFHKDHHPDLGTDHVLAGPRFSDGDRRGGLLKSETQ